MNFLHTAAGLCASFKSYREIRDLPVTSSIKYLLQLLATLAALLVLGTLPAMWNGSNRFITRFDNHRPDFSISNGRIVSNVTQPQVWGNDDLRFVLDTTGKEVKPDPRAATGLLFNADSFTFWRTVSDSGKPVVVGQTLKLAGYPEGPVTGAYIRRLVTISLCLGVPMSWVLLLLVGMFTCLMQSYFFSVVTSLMERTMPAPMTLPQLLNIAIHAVTPGTVIVTAYSIFWSYGWELTLNVLSLIYLIAFGIFFTGATGACRDKTRAEAKEEDDWM